MSTATWSLQAALYTALTGDTGLMALLAHPTGFAGVYARLAKAGAPLDYIVLGSSQETDNDTFGRPGKVGTEILHLWSTDIAKAKAIYAACERLLNRPRLTLAGHTMVRGRLEYLTDQTDPDGSAVQVVARYRAETAEG